MQSLLRPQAPFLSCTEGITCFLMQAQVWAKPRDAGSLILGTPRDITLVHQEPHPCWMLLQPLYTLQRSALGQAGC